MLKIRVMGSGLIPRIGTLAPKKEPFLADTNLIEIILFTKGLKPQYFDTAKQTFVDLTLANFKKVYAKFGNEVPPPERQVKEEVKAAIEAAKAEGNDVSGIEMKHQFSKKDKFSKKNKFQQRKQEEVKTEVTVVDNKI